MGQVSNGGNLKPDRIINNIRYGQRITNRRFPVKAYAYHEIFPVDMRLHRYVYKFVKWKEESTNEEEAAEDADDENTPIFDNLNLAQYVDKGDQTWVVVWSTNVPRSAETEQRISKKANVEVNHV